MIIDLPSKNLAELIAKSILLHAQISISDNYQFECQVIERNNR